MKRIIIITAVAVALSALIASPVSAGNDSNKVDGFGVNVGMTSTSTKIKHIETGNIAGFSIGVAYKIPLAGGFALQPGLQYVSKGNKVHLGRDIASVKTQASYLELPVQLQWGLDLGLCRPFALAEPFLGLNVGHKTTGSVLGISAESKQSGLDLQKLEYGVGLGFGVEIWKLQVSAKYFWNFGRLYNESEGKYSWSDIFNSTAGAVKNHRSYDGIAISVGLFF